MKKGYKIYLAILFGLFLSMPGYSSEAGEKKTQKQKSSDAEERVFDWIGNTTQQVRKEPSIKRRLAYVASLQEKIQNLYERKRHKFTTDFNIKLLDMDALLNIRHKYSEFDPEKCSEYKTKILVRFGAKGKGDLPHYAEALYELYRALCK